MDGKIEGGFMALPEAAECLQKYGELRGYYACDATLYGTTTMAEGYSDGLAPALSGPGPEEGMTDYKAPSDVSNYIVSLDPEGILGWDSGYIERKGRPRAHAIEVLTDRVKPAYLSYLRKAGVSYIFAGKQELDCGLALRKLKEQFGIERLMLAGGGITNASFLQEDLIDEVSLVVAPVAAGNVRAASVFERADFLPEGAPAAFDLKEVERVGAAGLWLQYVRK